MCVCVYAHTVQIHVNKHMQCVGIQIAVRLLPLLRSQALGCGSALLLPLPSPGLKVCIEFYWNVYKLR